MIIKDVSTGNATITFSNEHQPDDDLFDTYAEALKSTVGVVLDILRAITLGQGVCLK